MSAPDEIPHPGTRIRAEVIPAGMAVTKAAQLMGVGRPALSNLLNGKAALSADMAARLEKAFKFPLKELMAMQARYDAAQAKLKFAPVNTKAYVPPFLAIKANDIEGWVSHNIPARSRFAVFLRTLVHSTGAGLSKVDFPGNDDAERPGWDGFVVAGQETPWLPAGRSGWEFGVNDDPKAKAERDFEKSLKTWDEEDRAETTFVFVTPRRWAGKIGWVATKKAKGLWKDVRVYDASDLEQWLEQSLSGQAWFANEKHLPSEGVRSLDRCWADWAMVTTPPLTGALFASAIEVTKRTMLSRLSKPPERPIIVSADSTEEALAFLAQLFSESAGEELAKFRDRVLVFDRLGVLPRLAAGAQTFIPVSFTREVERELAPYATLMHSIVVYPRNAASADPDIVLEPAHPETFNTALAEMGKDRDEISRLANASGLSLTVLRRQLSTVPAVRTPEWAADRQTAGSLVPFLFVGAWNSGNETDRLGLSLLAGGRAYDELEKDCHSLAQLNDAPIWSLGTYRGVVSKIDLLYAIAGAVTSDDLHRYFSMARMVLGEDDPALDLDERKRWAASIHRKVREFSTAFREGISETLVLLAVHGDHLFKGRLGVHTEYEAVRVVRDLLLLPSLTTRVLEANERDLPTYAEAAPDEFLSILERDLRSAEPATLGLMRPVEAGVFGLSPSRTGLLWALEGLSWNPVTLPRAAHILARLSQIQINDNWINKPRHSLESIFRAWMPQTAANHQQRVDLIKKLALSFPEVAWNICIAQFGTDHEVGHHSHKPRWRPDGYGFGEPFQTLGPIIKFKREMIEMALTWPHQSLGTLCDLVQRLHDLPEADQARVWSLVETWANTKASDADKAAMREKIRVSTMSRRAALRTKNVTNKFDLAAAGKAAYAALEPSDLLNRHAWLFRDQWVEESADEFDDIEEIDFDRREERVKKLRIEALSEIVSQLGLAGILGLCEIGKAAWVIGVLSADALLSTEQLQQLVRLALTQIFSQHKDAHSYKSLIEGALRALIQDDKREAVLRSVAEGLSERDVVLPFILAPFRKSTWALVDTLGEEAQAEYWREVTPGWIRNSDVENNEAVERLLKAGRPRAAFSCIQLTLRKLDVQVLFRLLSAMAQGANDKPGHYMLEHYSLQEAFEHVNNSSALTLEQKAGLEFAYIEALARPWDRHSKYRIPNLERYVEAHPELFVQAVAWTYKRKDGAADPPEFQVPTDRISAMAGRGYHFLDSIKRIPGHNDLGELESDRLSKWIVTVRDSCDQLGRAEVADTCIGKMLSSAPVGEDGVWPCEPVRDVMEDMQSEAMMQGAHIGVYNSRGIHARGEGGDQERELAEKYRKWGTALQLSHPFVAAKLLMGLAQSYDRDADREDTEAGIRRRLR